MNESARYAKLGSIGILYAVVLIATLPSAEAQQDLILETEPERTVIPLVGTIRVESDGQVRATPSLPEQACQETSFCEGVDVNLTGFSANNQSSSLTVDQGASVAFRWSSQGAWSCTTTGDFPGWGSGNTKPQFATGSQQSVSTGSTSEGAYTAGLVCENGSVDSQTREVAITVNASDEPPPDPTDCPSNRQPPANWTRVTTCLFNDSSDCTDLSAIFGGSGSLADVATGGTRQLVLNRGSDREYWAMQFNTSGLSATRSRTFQIESTQNPAGAYGNGPKAITFSECPGDFNRSAIPSGCYFDAGFLGFITVGNADVGGSSSTARCKLELDKTYYFNVLYTSSSPGTGPDSLQPDDCADGNPGCGNQWSIQ